MRIRTLENLAGLMSQLHTLNFDSIGLLITESDNAILCVGAMIKVKEDLRKMSQGVDIWGTACPFKPTKAHLLASRRPWNVKAIRSCIRRELPFTFNESCDAWLESQAGDWTHDERRFLGLIWHAENVLRHDIWILCK